MKCPHCGKSLWFVRKVCAFCKQSIEAAPRPRSVIMLGWLFTVFGILGLLNSLFFISAETSTQLAELRSKHPLSYALYFINPALLAACGAGLLFGFNGARWFFTVYFGYNILRNLLSFGPSFGLAAFSTVLLFGWVVFLLFRPPARAFFCGPSPGKPAAPSPVS